MLLSLLGTLARPLLEIFVLALGLLALGSEVVADSFEAFVGDAQFGAEHGPEHGAEVLATVVLTSGLLILVLVDVDYVALCLVRQAKGKDGGGVGGVFEVVDACVFGGGEDVVEGVEGVLAEAVGLVDIGRDVAVGSAEEREERSHDVAVDCLGDLDGGVAECG